MPNKRGGVLSPRFFGLAAGSALLPIIWGLPRLAEIVRFEPGCGKRFVAARAVTQLLQESGTDLRQGPF